jgi:hypothetical protein
MTDYMSVLQHSIDTSVSMKLFKSREEATFNHVFNYSLEVFPLSQCYHLDNFDPLRLQSSAVKAYPLDNRPRGAQDISSVKYYQKQLQTKRDILPIWILKRKDKYILLDGAHRIVASHIEKKEKH